MAVWCDNLFLK